jgi:benzaldehyde dehydrogenase (NAD)
VHTHTLGDGKRFLDAGGGRMATEVAERPWTGKIFVDGEFREAEGGQQATVLDKGSGEELGRAGLASEGDLEAAIASARRAQRAWAAQPYDVRAGLLRRVAGLLTERADEIAELIVRETGAIAGKAEYEVGGSTGELHEAAGVTSRVGGEVVPSHNPDKLSIVQHVPVGVVAAITPWNFPLILGFRVVAPAIALGNAVVLKPAPETPLCGGLLIA